MGEIIHNSNGDLEKYQFCQHPVSKAEISASMGKHGFSNISTGYATIDLAPDSSKHSVEIVETMIEVEQSVRIISFFSTHSDKTEKVVFRCKQKNTTSESAYTIKESSSGIYLFVNKFFGGIE